MKLNIPFLVLAILLMVGCNGTPQPTLTATPNSQPPVAVATWTPISPAEAEQSQDVHEPRTPPAELGKAYPYELYTHCGVDLAVDFDGSFWQLSHPTEVPKSLGDPSQEGTMTLIAADSARFDFADGSLFFIRHQGPKHILPCA
jgi:hypothetical protein